VLDLVEKLVPDFTQIEYFTNVLSSVPGNLYSIMYLTVLLSWAETYYHLAHYTIERERLRESQSEKIGSANNSLVIHKITSDLSAGDERSITRLKVFYVFIVVLLSCLSILDSLVVVALHNDWLQEIMFVHIYCKLRVVLYAHLW
jgi:hypothetical protein